MAWRAGSMILVNIKRLKEGNFYKLESHLSKLLPTTLRAPRRPFILFFFAHIHLL